MRWFELAAEESERLLQGHHDPVLTLLSVLVAMLVGCMAMQVAGLARVSTRPETRQFALISGSVALGGGVWAMHFIGMLALDIGIPVQFAVGPTVMSLLPALGASWVALSLLARWRLSSWRLVVGGVLVGGGIGAMHYTGMAAMRMDARLSFDPLGFVASIVLAVLLAILALWIRFGLQRHGRRARERVLVGGTVMGLAIASMHFSGMGAARFVSLPETVSSPLAPGANSELAFGVALLVLVIVGLVMTANGVARYRDLYWRMQDNEARLRAVVDTAVDGIITIDRRGGIRSFNHSAERLFGWRESEVRGRNIKMLMPEPDRGHHDAYLANYLHTGKASIIGTGREVTALRKNGETVPIRLAIGETRVGGEPLFVGFVSDISAQRRLRASLWPQRSAPRKRPRRKAHFWPT